jgi:pimeloyl-ACP methyl ester carboxylesterase
MNEPGIAARSRGEEHWTEISGHKLFLWRKPRTDGPDRGTLLLVHGSSMAATPGFDLQAPGTSYVSAMDWFAARGFDCWTSDHRGYGRSYKGPEILATVSDGADDLDAVSRYIMAKTGAARLFLHGTSSGGLRAALFAERHPERVARLSLDAYVWTGKGSPTLAERKKKLDQWRASTRRPISRDFLNSIHTRDGVYAVDPKIVPFYMDAVLALDDSVPNGTYIDMCANLPVNDPKRLVMPVVIMRGEFDGIAATDDLLDFFRLLPNADKEFAIMPGIAHGSFIQTNHQRAFAILYSFLTRSEPVYKG